MHPEIQKFLKLNNQKLLEKIYTDFLSDEDIYKIFQILFPKPANPDIVDTNTKNFTGCFFISGHGREGAKDRPTILNAIIEKFNKLEEKDSIKEYIEKSVFMIIAMGMICVPAPMHTEIKTGGFRPNFTTSELDIVIPKTFFNVFNKYNKDNDYKIKLNNENLDLLHSLIKSQLRLNFYKIWSEPSPIALGEEDKELSRVKLLMKRKEIWVLKKLTSDGSLDRSYYLSPNKGESIKYFPHEGLHIIDIRDTNNQEMTDETMTDETNRDKMIGQLKDRLPSPDTSRMLKTKFIQKNEKRNSPDTKEEKIFDRIMNEIKVTAWIDLSTIIMLGYILDIKKLYIYDPACRPLVDRSENPNPFGPNSDRSLLRIPTK
jgi:hypothetical protein